MRTIRQLTDLPQETDYAKFPDSTIKNATETVAGTPVVREIYGDVLSNVYNLLRLAGITASGTEDNDLNGYQLVQAIRKLPNLINDTELPLSLSGTVFSVNLDITLLPDKYFLLVRAASGTVASTSYTFKGSTASPAYSFAAVQPFATGDELLLIIDHSGVRSYNLTATGSTITEMFTPFGAPLAYNDSSKVYYQSEGIIFSDLPEAFDLQAAIRVLESDGTILVYEMLLTGGYVLCLGFFPGTQTYKLYQFSASDLATPTAVTMTGGSFPTGSDEKPNIYTDGTHLYISNQTGNSANAYVMDIYTLALGSNSVTNTGSVSLDTGFDKTTNAIVKAGFIYTFVSGVLRKYNLSTGAVTLVNTFPAYVGILFMLAGDPYYCNGEVAKKWSI